MANAFTPEQLTEAVRNLSVNLNSATKTIDDLKGDVKDLEDEKKDILKRLVALEKKK